MTIRDREVLEELRDEPELLALADALVETQRIRRPFRPWSTVTVVALAAALFLLVLASPWDRGGSRVPILDRALAGIQARGPVLHAVISYADGWRVDLATGKTTPRLRFAEVWYDRELGRARFVARQDGKVLVDRTVAGSRRDLGILLFPIPVEETDYYREALAREDAKVVGEGTWHGHPVYWLELPNDTRPVTLRVGVDRRTYQPVVMRSVDADGKPTGTEIGLVDLEYVPRSQADFGKVEGTAGDGLMGSGGFGGSSDDSLSPARARAALGVPAVWAGEKLDGLPLKSLRLLDATYQEDGKQEHGDKQLQLVYGEAGAPQFGGSGVEINELAAGSPIWASVSNGPPPPEGFADLTSYVGTDGRSNDSSTVWRAALRVGQIWATVEAPTRELALAAARELRPIR